MVTPDRRFHRRGLFDAQAAAQGGGGGAFLAGLAAQDRLVSAWKPDVAAKTFNDYKNTRHFEFVDPLSQGFTWDASDGPLVGFGIGGDPNDYEIIQHQAYAKANWPALPCFAFHYVMKQDGVYQGTSYPYGVYTQENVGSSVRVWDTFVDPTASAPSGFVYNDHSTNDGSLTFVGIYDVLGAALSSTNLVDVCVSLGSDAYGRVWVNGQLVREWGQTGSILNQQVNKHLNAVAGILYTGDGDAFDFGADANYFLGPALLYNDAITIAEIQANRALFKTLGYASLP